MTAGPVPSPGAAASSAARRLREATVAIVTTAGLHAPEQMTWRGADQSYRVLWRSERRVRIGHRGANWDRSGLIEDLNVALPLDRLEECVEDGVIGAVAPRHLSFMGALPGELDALRRVSGPAAGRLLCGDGVDVVLLTPVGPSCTRTLCVLASVLERQGLATVMLSFGRRAAERLVPPRALHVDFPFGRPLGRPNDRSFQRRVLERAFALLDGPGPVLEDFGQAIGDGRARALTCPVPLQAEGDEPTFLAEVRGVREPYERHVARRGRTGVGRVVDVSGIPDAVSGLARVADGLPEAEVDVPLADLTDLAMDVRAYFEEAAAELAGVPLEARVAEAWFFEATQTGRVVLRACQRLAASGYPRELWWAMAPSDRTEQPDVETAAHEGGSPDTTVGIRREQSRWPSAG